MGRHLSKYLSECACAECLGGGNNPHKRSGTEFRRVYLRKHRNETYCNLRNIHGRNALGAQAVIDLLRAQRNADASLLSFESKYFRRLRSRSSIISRPIVPITQFISITDQVGDGSEDRSRCA